MMLSALVTMAVVMMPMGTVTSVMTMFAMTTETDCFLSVFQLVEQHDNEDDAADYADHQFNRDLIGSNHDSCNDIANQNEQRTEKRGIDQGSSNFVPFEQCNNVRDNQSNV